MEVKKFIFGSLSCFLIFLFMFLLVYVYAIVAASTVSAEEDFFLVFISQKDKTAKIISKNPSLRSCQENTEESILGFSEFLQQEQEKHGLQICCVNREQTEYVCFYLDKNPLAEGRDFKKDI